jgi:hypothetical protein
LLYASHDKYQSDEDLLAYLIPPFTLIFLLIKSTSYSLFWN